MMKNFIKKNAEYVIAIAILVIIAAVYLSPMLTGKDLSSNDGSSWLGMSKEARDYTKKTGEATGWTNSMFSGMPTYIISFPTYAAKPIDVLNQVYRMGGLPFSALSIVICSLLGAFILMKSLKVNTKLSIAGAIAVAFSSYFFIILEAGHPTKAMAIAYMLPVIAGFIFIFRQKKYLLGAMITALFVAFDMNGLHIQMTYYFYMMIMVLFLTELIDCFKSKEWRHFLIASLLFFGASGLGILPHYAVLANTEQYTKETMRGGHSELTQPNAENEKKTGLDLVYATQWSYGIDETMTLLIPDFKGGSSSAQLSESSAVYKALIQNGVPRNEAQSFSKSFPMYWGNQPMTAGPVYVGAIVVFLFLLGFYIVKTPYKWGLLVAILFSIMLAWGKNFMWLTELFMQYVPFYNKFRAVSSILVVAEVAIPMLAFLAIGKIWNIMQASKGNVLNEEKKELLQKIKISMYVTGGICLFFALFGGLIYDFKGPSDVEIFANFPVWLQEAVVEGRADALRFDAIRSLLFIVAAAVAMIYWIKGRLKPNVFIIIFSLLILIDMWGIDKRYLNDSSFADKKKVENPFQPTEADLLILQDPDIHYRVFNVAVNTFNDASTSYFHKSIGGYSPAKLRRYQDLIERHISKGNVKVLNMLNAKYFIVPRQNASPDVQRNVSALGNAWFVDSIQVVNSPDEEIEMLNSFEPNSLAIMDTSFAKHITKKVFVKDTANNIKLISYQPNELVYEANNLNEAFVVFSEIYYPQDWHAFVDGKEYPIYRVNYILRGLELPGGKHQITFKFTPDTYNKYFLLSRMASWLVVLLVLGSVGYVGFRTYRRKKDNQ